jgi:hypothetical protein
LLGVVTLVSTVGAAVLAGPAVAGGGGGSAPATIEKVADGAPPGTTFTIELSCTGMEPPIVPPGGDAQVSSLEFTFTVDDTGTAVPDGANTVSFVAETECTVTETDSAAAESTSYACADNAADFPDFEFCTTFGPQPDPISFLVQADDQDVTVTVTNTFPPPPVPEPVEIEPAFTG